MIRRRLVPVLLAGSLLAPTARADQFLYLDLPQAQAALRHLRVGDVVHLYCAPCGEQRSQRMTIRGIGLDRVWDRAGGARVYRDTEGTGFWLVEVNDEALDLAYVYVREGRRWRNLASLLRLDVWKSPVELPKSATGTRWRCGARYDNPYWTVLEQRRDPCPIDAEALEAKARNDPRRDP